MTPKIVPTTPRTIAQERHTTTVSLNITTRPTLQPSTSSPSSSNSSLSSILTSTSKSSTEEETTMRLVSVTPVDISTSTTLTSTSYNGTTSTFAGVTIPDRNDGISPGAGLAIFILVVAVIVGSVAVYILYRRGKCKSCPRQCSSRCCWGYVRARTSSTLSHKPLNQDDTASVDIPDPKQERELFSIAEQDGGEDGRGPRMRSRRETDEGYFYDEIFERSAFVDERTNSTNKQLTMEDGEEIDIPDLIFKGTHSRI